MDFEIGRIILFCFIVLAVVMKIIRLIIARRRVEKMGILCVKYPIRDRTFTVICVIAAVVGVYMMIINIVNYIPYYNTVLKDYRTNFSQDPELYGERIEFAEEMLKANIFEIVVGAIDIVIMFLLVFTRGAYITKEGVVPFGDFKPLMTTARIKQGSIKFYTRSSRESKKRRKYQYAFELPESEDNRELFKDFIKITGAKA